MALSSKTSFSNSNTHNCRTSLALFLNNHLASDPCMITVCDAFSPLIHSTSSALNMSLFLPMVNSEGRVNLRSNISVNVSNVSSVSVNSHRHHSKISPFRYQGGKLVIMIKPEAGKLVMLPIIMSRCVRGDIQYSTPNQQL